jgi:dihydrofolate reductase
MKINVIVAYSNNLVIGNDNEIPWNYKEDLEYFKTITTYTRKPNQKNVVIMGYNTWLSIGKKLKNRINIVITTKTISNELFEDELYFVDSIGLAIDICKKEYNKKIDNIFIIGGEKIYSYFFKSYFYTLLDKIYITKINKDYEGNKYFLNIDNKFYYTEISTSYIHKELEYRVLQYKQSYIHPDNNYILYMLKIINRKNSIEFGYTLKYDLSSYFPLVTILNLNINEILNNYLNLLNNDIIKNDIDNIIKKIKNNDNNDLVLKNINNSNYFFHISDDNKLLCIIYQEKSHIINDIPISIFIGGLLLYTLSFITKIKMDFLIYSCTNAYILDNERNICSDLIDKISKPLPLLEITDNNQLTISDFKLTDFIFLGID